LGRKVAVALSMLSSLPQRPVLADVTDKEQLELQLQKLQLQKQLLELQQQMKEQSDAAAGSAPQSDTSSIEIGTVENAPPPASENAPVEAAAEPAVITPEPPVSTMEIYKPAPIVEAEIPKAPEVTAYDFKVPFNGEPVPMKQFLGQKATIIFNPKLQDPKSGLEMNGIDDLMEKYASKGLKAVALPSQQGWHEIGSTGDRSKDIRFEYKNAFKFGKYPIEIVADLTDLIGRKQLPLTKWLTTTLPNPWGVNRIVVNYEKFLLDENGHAVRRYPRSFPFEAMEDDLLALLNGEELPPASPEYERAWEYAKKEAKTEYAYKIGYNVFLS
jgi:glutathione peroxidase